MILTGREIEKQVGAGRIHIQPFEPEQVRPNSYDFRLGGRIVCYRNYELDARRDNPTVEIEIPDEGLELTPGRIYLAHTEEIMGSDTFVPTIRAKSSTARLGLFVHVTADLIDIGSINQWTLQLVPVQPIRVYPRMLIGQVTFWTVEGDIELYTGKYQHSRGPQPSKSWMDFRS
jgi:dCTP deaminase